MTIIEIRNLKKRGNVAALRTLVAGQRERLSFIRERDYHYRAARLADPKTQVSPVGDRAAHLAGAADASKRIAKAPHGSRALRRAAERALASVERRMARAAQ